MNKLKKIVFPLLSFAMASPIMEKIYKGKLSKNLRARISRRAEKAGVAMGYRSIILDVKLISLTKNEYQEMKNRLEQISKKIIKESMTQEEKARAIFDYLVDHLEYDYSTKNNSAYMALQEGQTMCAGYAQLFLILGRQAGLHVKYQIGEAGGDIHIWNVIKINGKQYHIDATWTDKARDKEYFMLSDEELKITHHW